MNTSIRRIIVGVFSLASVCFAAAHPPSQFYFTATEIHGYADMNGNGMLDAVLIDRATGSVRIAFANAGTPQWSPPHPAGLYGVTGVTAGRFIHSNRDTLALTAPLTNRVFYFSLSGPDAIPQTGMIAPSPVGPHSLAAGNLQGTSATEDIVLLSNRNFNSLHRVDFLTIGSNGTITNATQAASSNVPYSSAQRVMLNAVASNQIGYLDFSGLGATLRVRALGTSGQPELFAIDRLDPQVRYLLQPLSSGQGELVTWVEGGSQYTVRVITSTLGVYSIESSNTVSVPFALGMVSAVPADDTSQLLLISQDGTQALIRPNASTAAGQAIDNPQGLFFTGVLPLPNGDGRFLLLLGISPFGRAVAMHNYAFDGTNQFLLDDADAVPIASPTSGSGNVLVYAGEPFVAPNAVVLSRMRAGDWSSNPVLSSNVQVAAESYQGASQGVGNPVNVQLGAAPASATHVLVNQLDPAISVFALSPAHGTAQNPPLVSPTPGIYPTAVQVSISGQPLGWLLRYRTSPDQLWQSYTKPIWIHKTTTLEVMAVLSIFARTPITAVTYTIPTQAGELSTMDDGVPDYVKIGKGYDPTGLPDRDGVVNSNSSYNYLQILLDGAVADPRVLSEAFVRLHVRAFGHNGTDDNSIATFRYPQLLADGSANPGLRLDVRDTSGELIDTALADSWDFFGIPDSASVLESVGYAGRSSILIAATSPHYPLAVLPPYDAGSLLQGREIVSLLTVPESTFVPYTRSYTGGSDADEADAWINGAISHFNSLPLPESGATVNGYSTTALLLFEQFVTRALVQRGVLPAAYLPNLLATVLPANRLTLTPFRGGENATELVPGSPTSGTVFATPEILQSLASYHSNSDPGFNLVATAHAMSDALTASVDPRIIALRAVTDDIYRISARWAGLFPGSFPSPVDALRSFVLTGSPPAGYTNNWPQGLPATIGSSITALTAADYAAARQGFALLLDLPAPRPFVSYDLRVIPAGASLTCTVLERVDTLQPVALLKPDGSPFRFPASFQIIPNSVLSVSGYSDVAAPACAPLALELASFGDQLLAVLNQIPLPAEMDDDDNLLPDDWELLFLGSVGNDSWSSPAGDGYSLLQIFLSGGDPLKPLSYNFLPPVLNGPPPVVIEPASFTDLMLSWEFPAAFADFVEFSLEANDDLSADWSNLGASVNYLGNNRFYLTVPDPADPLAPRFWRLAMRLR